MAAECSAANKGMLDVVNNVTPGLASGPALTRCLNMPCCLFTNSPVFGINIDVSGGLIGPGNVFLAHLGGTLNVN